MLSREAVFDALERSWKILPAKNLSDAFSHQADAILALLPSDEALGRAAVNAVIPAIGYHGEGLTRLDKNYTEISLAIREELGKE